jgi:putative methionine-R-sulfoxide reductase with GAF domain
MNARDMTSEPDAGRSVTQPGTAVDAAAPRGLRSEFSEMVRQWSVDALHLTGTAPTERFDRITRVAQQVLGIDQAAITFIDHDRQWYKADTGGHAGSEIARTESFCTHTIEQSDVYVVPDTEQDPLFRDNTLAKSAGIRFYAGQPLLGPGGEPVGALCVYGSEPREFTETEQQTLRDLALWVQDELAVVSESAEGLQVQQGLLPAPLVSLTGYHVAGACLPLRSVGGDFYDWYPVAGGAAFTFGGVMGRGVAAAIVAATVRATMRASSRSNGAAAAVETAADTLDADLTAAGAFVTLFHGHLEEETGLLRYIDAGHGLSLIVHRDGRDEHLPATGVPLGAGFESVWEERTATLLPGDVFVSVSDGVLDAFGGTLDALARVGALARSAETVDAVVEAIVAAASHGAPDDVTVVAVRRDDAFRIAA